MSETSTREEILSLIGDKWAWIRIRNSTKSRLQRLGMKGDTYDDVIKALLQLKAGQDVKSA